MKFRLRMLVTIFAVLIVIIFDSSSGGVNTLDRATTVVCPSRGEVRDPTSTNRPAQQWVCRSKYMRLWDKHLVEMTNALIDSSDDSQQETEQHEVWVFQRDNCPDLRCVDHIYVERLKELSTVLDEPWPYIRYNANPDVNADLEEGDVPFCDLWLRNMNAFPLDTAPHRNLRPIHPDFEKWFYTPDWEQLDPWKNLQLLKQLHVAAMPEDHLDSGSEFTTLHQWKIWYQDYLSKKVNYSSSYTRQFKGERLIKGPEIRRAVMTFNKREGPKTVYGYRRFKTIPFSARRWDVDGGFSYFVYDEDAEKYRSIIPGYVTGRGMDIVLFKWDEQRRQSNAPKISQWRGHKDSAEIEFISGWCHFLAPSPAAFDINFSPSYRTLR